MTLVGVWAGSQRLIRRGEQSGLWTRMATERSLSRADEKLTAFIELEAAVRDKESRPHRPC
jgi:hypothetical protein